MRLTLQSPALQSSISWPIRTVPALGVGLATALAIAAAAIASAAVASEPGETVTLESPLPAGSEALVTQPAQTSTFQLPNAQPDSIRVEDEPTLIFMLDETITSPRQQIEENKPPNSNAIHFPIDTRSR